MSQHSMNIPNESGAEYRADVNAALQALASQSRGATGPATTYAGQIWLDTTTNLRKRRNAANSAWLVEGTLDEIMVIPRSSNTVLGVSDMRKRFLGTGTYTQTFESVPILGADWFCYYRNNGAGVITLDPTSAETINGLATLPLQPGDGGMIFCDGTALYFVGALTGPAFSVNLGGVDQGGVSSAAYTKILHNTVEYDTYAAFDLINHRYVVKVPGLYQFILQSTVAALTTDQVLLNSLLYINGAEYGVVEPYTSGTGAQTSIYVGQPMLAVGDYVEHYFRIGAPGTSIIHGSSHLTKFSGRKI